MRGDRETEIVGRQLELRPGNAGIGGAENAVVMLHPHHVGRAGAARHAMRILHFKRARLFGRHIGGDQAIAAQKPALAVIAGIPDAAAGNRHEQLLRVARVGRDGMDAGVVIAAAEPFGALRHVPQRAARAASFRRGRRSGITRREWRRPRACRAALARPAPASRSETASARRRHRRGTRAPAAPSRMCLHHRSDAACCPKCPCRKTAYSAPSRGSCSAAVTATPGNSRARTDHSPPSRAKVISPLRVAIRMRSLMLSLPTKPALHRACCLRATGWLIVASRASRRPSAKMQTCLRSAPRSSSR